MRTEILALASLSAVLLVGACASLSGLSDYDLAPDSALDASAFPRSGDASTSSSTNPPGTITPPGTPNDASADDGATPPPPPPGTPPPQNPPPGATLPPSAGVRCGGHDCVGTVCCDDGTETCASACGPNSLSYACDGPEDCDGKCCALPAASPGEPSTNVGGSVCTALCAVNSIVCHTTADCTSGTCQANQGGPRAPSTLWLCRP